jgi:hypothetical protein
MVIYLAPRYEENLCTPAITHCKVVSSFIIISDTVFAQSRNYAEMTTPRHVYVQTLGKVYENDQNS